jgi:hypothetical protein
MRTLFRNLFVLSTITALASCGLLGKKGDADAGAEAAVADTTTDAAGTAPVATGPVAVNENDIARFPDETKLADVAATVRRFAFLRESPQNGKVITSLNNGQAVTEIAQRQTFFLVTVDVAGQKKMGWLTADAFQPVVDAGLKAPVCNAPLVPLMGDQPFCGKVCGGDVDCPSGEACKGTAQRFSANTLLPGTVAVCTVVNRPQGTSSFTIDSGAPAQPAAVGDIVAPPCPAGFTTLKDGRCHRQCVTGTKSCQLFCLKCEGKQVCNLTNKCP